MYNLFAMRLMPLVLVLSPACTDGGFTRHNALPEVEILSPVQGEALREATLLTLRGAASDPDDAAKDLVARWYVDDVQVCETLTPNTDGSVECAALVPSAAFRVDLEVRDPEGAAAVASVALEVIDDLPPTAEITAPTAAGPWYSDRPVPLEGRVSDPEDAAETLEVRWVSSLDGELAATATVEPEGTVHGYGTLSAGTHALQLFVTDSAGQDASDDVVITVGPPNRAPACAVTAPSDGGVSAVGQTVALAGTVSDPELAPDALTVGWASSRDGALGAAPADASGHTALDTAALTVGEHALTLTATDELGASCVAGVTWTVGTPPTLVVDAPTAGQVENEGEALPFGARVADAEDAATALWVTWVSDLDGVLAEGFADAAGRSEFALADLSVGAHLITVTVTDRDGLSTVELVDVRVNGLPGAPVVSLSPVAPLTADDLVTSIDVLSTDPDGDALGYTYAWTVDGVASAASYAATLPESATARGETWTVYVYASDAWGTGPAGTASVTIGNTAPSLAALDITPDPATRSATLTCTPSGYADADGDADQTLLEWTVDGVAAGTGPTLASGFTTGQTVTCQATPFDGTDTGLVLYDSLVIQNSPPEVTSLVLSPTTPYTDDTLSAAVSASDPEGDTITLAYAWTVNGAAVSTAPTLAGSAFAKGDVVELTVTPSDADGAGHPGSASVTIANTPPGAPSLALDPADPEEGEAVVCDVTTASTDADGDTVTYRMAWTVDGVAYPSGGDAGPSTVTWPDDEMSAADTEAGEWVTCTVTPDDGEDTGTAASTSVEIDNAVTRVFVSSTGLNGGFGALTVADAVCQADADAVGLGGTWVAWISSASETAASRIPEGPYVRLDGAVIATTKADLTDGSISVPINIKPNGSTHSDWVLTGTTYGGSASYSGSTVNGLCANWTNGCGVCYGNHYYMTIGRSYETDRDWTDTGWLFCSSAPSLYCFEQ